MLSPRRSHRISRMGISLIAIVILVALGLMVLALRGEEDTWLCRNGAWVRHGQPAAPMPQEPCL